MPDLPKTFDPAAIEARWYPHWEANGLFRPDRPDAEPWTIVNPPPNVTGALHIGHALDNTLQDILTRHARLKGKDALWVVGTDHAGIATQMVVERNLESQGVRRQEMGREAFLDHVWEWKAQSGGAITRQLRRLGCSMDWSREQFTMDPHFVRAVNKVFVQLYREGLLYRDKRLVNWDPHFRTAISDLEVEMREVDGFMWHFRYPLADGGGHIAIATTRPETILGDGAVAVHPDDERYAHLVGRLCRLPIVERLIPIIADPHVERDFGSGAVKITAAHDYNDYEVYKRHPEVNIPLINLMTDDARMNESTPAAYRGLDRYEARAKVVADFEALGLLDKIEPHRHNVPFGDRSGVVIEPMLTDQWYVDAAALAKPAIEAVRSGAIKVVPKSWEKTWYNWLENIQPWCVSRQLWWGHQVPAWYAPRLTDSGYMHAWVRTGAADQESTVIRIQEPIVCETDQELPAELSKLYGRSVSADQIRIFDDRRSMDLFMLEVGDAVLRGDVIPLLRDADVLDTWFSSALWPFVTLGWPEEEKSTAATSGLPELVEACPERLPQAGSRRGHSFSTRVETEGKEGASTSSAKPALGRSLLDRHYPNDVLVSGFDIIFFWDARMAMQGVHFMKEVPWRTLYLHGLVRDAKGQKMSKSKGNTVDPLGLIDRYGADALRFTLAAMESQGRDIKLDEKRVEGYRNFATKLWNAARFCQANGIGASAHIAPPAATLPVNRWIIGETVKTVQALDLALADLRFDESANTVYQFVWATFCDWYLELIKPLLTPLPIAGGDEPRSGERDGVEETREVAGWVLDQILVMLHPFMPFVTEELWHALASPAYPRPYELILAKWPMPDALALDSEAGPEIDWLIRLVSAIRTARAELNVPPGARLPLHVRDAGALTAERLARQGVALQRLARIGTISDGPAPSGGAVQVVVDEATFILPLSGVIDIAAERARLAKAAEAAEKERDSLAARLANPSFVERAKPEAIEKARADHADKASDAEKYRAALARLG